MGIHVFRNVLAVILIGLHAAPAALAHFPWLTTDKEHNALLFFSESPSERTYRVPECVEKATVMAYSADGKGHELALKRVEKDDFNGRVSEKPVKDLAALTCSIEYGVYHGTLLRYYVKHAPLAEKKPKQPLGDLKLNATPIRTKKGLRVMVTWDGKPLPGATVALTDSKGQQDEKAANKRGVAKFTSFAEGPVSFLIAHGDKEANGKFGDQEYQSESYYMTLTSSYSKAGAHPHMHPTKETKQEDGLKANSTNLPELPVAVASFGGAVCDGYLYVYSGHTGTQHEHSAENLSKFFGRLKIDGGEAWEELPVQQTLQGMPLVAHGGKLYRVGGVHSRNKTIEDPEDMHSSDVFACFDPKTKEWTQMASLPNPRSSHDATVIGDSIYVVGGWNLTGDSPGDWQADALRFDLTDPEKGWQTIKQPLLARRALAVSQLNGKLVALGGMAKDSKRGVVNNVNQYDPKTDSWSSLPDLPGSGINSFGVSAWNHGGLLYVNGMEGKLYRLDVEAGKWQPVARVAQSRFFHRLLSAGPDKLLIVGGAAPNGHLASVEVFDAPK